MSTCQPLRKKEDIQKMKDYFYNRQEWRNYALIIVGLNTALRINDILHIKWNKVYNKKTNCFYSHIHLIEQKTQKETFIALNHAVIEALTIYKESLKHFCDTDYIFCSSRSSNQPLSRVQAFRIIKDTAKKNNLGEHISCHSLRKTFGYQAWKNGAEPALLMNIYNHSSYEITKRYLGIDQDDKDDLFLEMNL